MPYFGDRIKKARLLAGLSQEGLANAISQLFDKKKISRTAITQWESNKTNGIEASNLLKATKVLNVNPDWLLFGYGSMRPFDLGGMTLKTDRVPLLNNKEAAHPKEPFKEVLAEVGLDESLAEIAEPYSFALIINDHSMAPVFTPHDLVLIDPSIKPHPGDYVAAKLTNEKSVVFRKYRPASHFLTNQFKLIPVNDDWEEMILTEQNSEVIGTLIEHRCKRRIDKSK